jgi:hypothetical protein
MAGPKKQTRATAEAEKRTYISQADIPSVSIEQALRIARALADNYAYKPAAPLRVASAMNMQPDSGPFRLICGAAIAYGLTKGGYNASEISLEPLGLKIVRPLTEGEDLLAKREAILRPRVVGEFLRRYDKAKFPRDDIARNVLQDLGVPPDRTTKALELIVEGARSVGLLHDIKGTTYVDLAGAGTGTPTSQGGVEPESDLESDDEEQVEAIEPAAPPPKNLRPVASLPRASDESLSNEGARRVFITHGKNRSFIEPLKKLLKFGEMEAVVATERESVSVPVPDKVMNEMRRCGAAIIHVEDEMRLLAPDATEHIVLNPNVLIEIGAAIALYGRRFILLVKDGVKLPSNLQGLYEVRYASEKLDGDTTIKLLEAINDIKNHVLPGRST